MTSERKTLRQMTEEIRAVNVEKGWRPAGGGPGSNTLGDYIALLHSEVSEALEAYRDHRLADATTGGFGYVAAPQPFKPEGVGSELADVLIRLLDMADVFGIRVSGYEYLSVIHNRQPDSLVAVTTFGDWMAWLHYEISMALILPDRIAIVLRTLVTVARRYGIDLGAEYARKIAYNRTRAFQHGGRTLAEAEPADPGLAPSDTSGTMRYNTLWMTLPDDPRGWWTSEEVDVFIEQWFRQDMPTLTLHDATGERLTLWCTDVRYAAALVDMANASAIDNDGFEICKGEYSVSIVQADEK
jgi:NTP pyrophosphatase (non-canonical NTP hydrolase)